MSGIIGKKIGMTSIYSAEGKNIPCTVIEAGPCVVTQVKNDETDGYSAVQLAYGERKEKNTPKALKGHFDKANTPRSFDDRCPTVPTPGAFLRRAWPHRYRSLVHGAVPVS